MRGTLLFAIFSIMSVLSILFVDKPLALWIHKVGFDQFISLRYITEMPQYWLSIICITVMLIFPTAQQLDIKVDRDTLKHFKFFKTSNLIYSVIKILYFVCIVLLALWLKTKLKIFFGREWPLHWGGSHGGLIPDGIYQFNILKSNNWQGSFPSGHATFAAIAGFIMYLLYQRAKYVWLALAMLLILAILALNYHFVGDCIAGTALGGLFAYYGVAVYYYVIKNIFAAKIY